MIHIPDAAAELCRNCFGPGATGERMEPVVPSDPVSTNHTVVEEVPELFVRAVRDGFMVALFRNALQMIDDSSAFDENDSPELIQQVKADCIETLKHQLRRAIEENFFHCGHPVQTRGVFDVETGRHSILVRCSQCGNHVEIKEAETA